MDVTAYLIRTCYQTCFQSKNDFRILDEQWFLKANYSLNAVTWQEWITDVIFPSQAILNTNYVRICREIESDGKIPSFANLNFPCFILCNLLSTINCRCFLPQVRVAWTEIPATLSLYWRQRDNSKSILEFYGLWSNKVWGPDSQVSHSYWHKNTTYASGETLRLLQHSSSPKPETSGWMELPSKHGHPRHWPKPGTFFLFGTRWFYSHLWL